MADLNGDGKESFTEKIQGVGETIGDKAGELRDNEMAKQPRRSPAASSMSRSTTS